MKKVAITLFLLISLTSSCQGQNDLSYYDREKIYIEWKESILDNIDSLIPTMGNELHNFFVGVCQIRFSAFSNMVDTLSKYEQGTMPQYYIVFHCNVREGESDQLILRTYSNMNIGHEVRSYGRNKFENIVSKPYLFNKDEFNIINKDLAIKNNHPFHIFSISVFKLGHFETKLFSVSNPEDAEMLDKFLPYIGGW